MVLLIILAALALWSLIALIVELRRDGYRRTPTDWERVAARDVRQEAEAAHAYR